jgi:tripartite-type tricarboxylate transporter receptor subunit TctC
VIGKLNATIGDILRSEDVQRDIVKLGGTISIGSAQDFAAFVARESERWRKVADAGNIKVD